LLRPKPLVLIILDGFGVAEPGPTNAVHLANTPTFDWLYARYPHATLKASGEDVGLPDGQMGNSEVGHLNIGAGRIVYQDLTRISKAIKTSDFAANPVLNEALTWVLDHNSQLHLMGLLSDGGVHSHNTHLYALLKLAKERGVKKIIVHCFLDGRDTPPQSGLSYLKELKEELDKLKVGQIGTVMGRYYAMDRDKRWPRTELAYKAIVHGEGEKAASPEEVISRSYAAGANDEFVKPTVLPGHQQVKDKDAVIFFNFRADRARQLTQAFIDKEFTAFKRGQAPDVLFVSFTEYDIRFPIPVAFPPEKLKNTFTEVLAQNNLKQLHVAETEKYAHVTFFFNGGVEKPVPGEDRILVPSPKVATYDLQPEMSAFEVSKKVCQAITAQQYDFIVANFANPDMVGHTGMLSAAVKAVETVDQCLSQIIAALKETTGELLIIADHGNLEKMAGKDGHPWTAHTANPVPIIYVSDKEADISNGGRLADVAPTLLTILNLPIPPEMTGRNLIKVKSRLPR